MTTPGRNSRKPGVMDAWPRFVLAAILSAAVHGGLLFGVIMMDGNGQGQRLVDRAVPISVISRTGSLVRSGLKPLGGPPSPATPGPIEPVTEPNTHQRTRRAQTARPPEPGLNGAPSTETMTGTGSGVGANDNSPAGSGTESGVGANDTSPAGSGTEIMAQRQYALDVRRLLEHRGAYPGTARRLGLEGMVEMLLRVDSSGTIFEKRVLSSSGHPQLDRAALASADRLGRLPPPPSGQPVDIRVPVRFSMKRN